MTELALFAVYHKQKKCYLSHGGRVIVHTNPTDLEYIFWGLDVRVEPLITPVGPCMMLRDFPQLEGVVLPSDRKESKERYFDA